MQRYRSWVPLSKLDEELAAELWMDVPQSTRLAWFMLLKDEGILELDHDGLASRVVENVRCRLNVTDAVVRAIVAETEPSDESGAAAAGWGAQDGGPATRQRARTRDHKRGSRY